MFSEQEKPKIDSNKLERQDIDAGFEFLLEIYQKELNEKDSKVTPEVLESNLGHTKRVVENMKRIAQSEKLDEEKMELAAILHDIGKLRHDLPGGIDTFGHHETSAEIAKDFIVKKLNKSTALTDSVGDMIERHSYIPFIKRVNPDIPEPITWEDLALRDADVLDMINIHGLRKIVEIRQNPQSKFYQEDNGKLDKAISSALKSNQESVDILVTPEAKTIAKEFQEQTKNFLKELKSKKVKTLIDFQKVFDEFVKK